MNICTVGFQLYCRNYFLDVFACFYHSCINPLQTYIVFGLYKMIHYIFVHQLNTLYFLIWGKGGFGILLFLVNLNQIMTDIRYHIFCWPSLHCTNDRGGRHCTLLLYHYFYSKGSLTHDSLFYIFLLSCILNNWKPRSGF